MQEGLSRIAALGQVSNALIETRQILKQSAEHPSVVRGEAILGIFQQVHQRTTQITHLRRDDDPVFRQQSPNQFDLGGALFDAFAPGLNYAMSFTLLRAFLHWCRLL